MKRKKKGNKYVELSLILFGVILITLAGSNLYKHKQESIINKGYLSKYIASVKNNELENVMLELSTDAFFYISYTGDSKIHELEVHLKKILDDHELIDNIVYIDATKHIEDENFLNEINKKLNLEDKKIEKIPAIIYYRDNELIEILDSRYQLLKASNFYNLLDKYEIINDLN